MGADKGNALILKVDSCGNGTALSKEGELGSTAAFNRFVKTFVTASKMETSVGGGDTGKRVVGMILE